MERCTLPRTPRLFLAPAALAAGAGSSGAGTLCRLAELEEDLEPLRRPKENTRLTVEGVGRASGCTDRDPAGPPSASFGHPGPWRGTWPSATKVLSAGSSSYRSSRDCCCSAGKAARVNKRSGRCSGAELCMARLPVPSPTAIPAPRAACRAAWLFCSSASAQPLSWALSTSIRRSTSNSLPASAAAGARAMASPKSQISAMALAGKKPAGGVTAPA
mmetsp:Transcript_9256/g.30627  ORF Transcript_9256/g.30627 Transcript_9256/m.30627 type:complete len:217 (-) Transcript_9256:682-1332(-)|eukprot:scaffold36300_cov123-Isochrysis_galbana.AAC.8